MCFYINALYWAIRGPLSPLPAPCHRQPCSRLYILYQADSVTQHALVRRSARWDRPHRPAWFGVARVVSRIYSTSGVRPFYSQPVGSTARPKKRIVPVGRSRITNRNGRSATNSNESKPALAAQVSLQRPSRPRLQSRLRRQRLPHRGRPRRYTVFCSSPRWRSR